MTFDYDTLVPCPDRAALRLLHSTSRWLIDGFAKSYRDVRRSATPAEVADRAVSALLRVPSLRRLQLEGLDDAALMTVVAGLRHAPRARLKRSDCKRASSLARACTRATRRCRSTT